MKFLFAAITFAIMTFQPAQAQEKPKQTPISQGVSYQFPSATYDKEREINVWLPQSYESGKERKYPVLYLIDGGVDQDFPHIAGLAQHGAISWNFEQMIVIGVKTNTRVHELTQPAQDERYGEYQKPNGGADTFRHFIADEVKPWVDVNYRTNGNTAIIGESLAALFVVDTLLNKPQLFDDYIAISPSLWWNRENLANQSAALLSKHDGNKRRLYITMANEGGTMQRGLDTFLDALREHKPEQLAVHYVDRHTREEHGSIYHIAALDAFRRLYGLPHRTGSPSAAPWLFIGKVPEISDFAKESIKQECNHKNAKRVSFADVAKNPDDWRGVCILPDSFRMNPGSLDK